MHELISVSIGEMFPISSDEMVTFISNAMIYLGVGFLFFVVARLFRIAAVEIEKSEDKEFLFGVFASVTSLISLIIALVALIIEIK